MKILREEQASVARVDVSHDKNKYDVKDEDHEDLNSIAVELDDVEIETLDDAEIDPPAHVVPGGHHDL